eukprot:CAMPEP_0194270360 /NCGR_PEP_ID=MMETSP0169-20130528/4353_1 /TAXON_ID=218684 /ORGANISM="Corethron pennatum, Strain L29A3" /LENGTH=354 /DNA_ID=CAMNT_0039012371 /DNA_START=249 /DNA_END=1310 /DNA_ORIENTATION=+
MKDETIAEQPRWFSFKNLRAFALSIVLISVLVAYTTITNTNVTADALVKEHESADYHHGTIHYPREPVLLESNIVKNFEKRADAKNTTDTIINGGGGPNKSKDIRNKKKRPILNKHGVDKSGHTVPGGTTGANVVYGLVHMAKTGGTEINGELDTRYKRVCGNKGYSDQSKKIAKSINGFGKTASVMRYGFEDCDYVALETKATMWAEQFGSSDRRLQLHVPCRPSLDMLMSLCNHFHKDFLCRPKFEKEVDKCLQFFWRFGREALTHPNIDLKCFSSPARIQDYLHYMEAKLTKNEHKGKKYVHISTNDPRNKDTECIWTKDEDYIEKVVDYLTNKSKFKDYFAFCEECMDSE